jgi:CheY-like chemotaxis protein
MPDVGIGMKTRILIVDDESEYTSLIKASLEVGGYFQVAEENDAACAVDKAREFQPDLILLDIMMPNLEGNEVAALLRENPQFRTTPIVFLTALISEVDAPKGYYFSAGYTFVTKLMSIDRLMQLIKDLINERRRLDNVARGKGVRPAQWQHPKV